jgi:60 kDa SS-A/Ro ribonucleoprotein
MDYTRHFSTVATPQTQPIPGAKTPQVPNSAGGYSWAVDDWTRLDRFLILGSEKGTYYISEHKLTVECGEAALRCIAKDGPRVVERVREISEAARAPKNDPALFVLALCMKKGDEHTRRLAYQVMPKVARIGTHLFHLAQSLKGLGGIKGSGMTRAFKRWYQEKSAKDLAYQLAKYQARDGWSHHDILKLAHPCPKNPLQEGMFGWVREGILASEAIEWAVENGEDDAVFFLQAVNALRGEEKKDVKEVCGLISEFRLPMEVVPNEVKNHPEVWAAMLPHMGITAVVRNLAKMTSVGLLVPNSTETKFVTDLITNAERLKKGKVHPIQMLLAMATYASGHGMKGSLTWTPVRQIVDALDEGFYQSFGAVEPANKRICYALDVSASMDGNRIAGTYIDARMGAAAMALVCARTEETWEMMGFSHTLVPVNISPRQRLDDVIKTMQRIQMGGTDCALPMRWAAQEKRDFDAFVVLTDSETWAGRSGHPAQWLQRYRQQRAIAAKLVVVGMCSSGFSIADPDDGGMIDVVGFDASAPNIISDFIRE